MTTWRNAPVWWRVAFGVVVATALVWSARWPEALVWAVAALFAGWQVQAAEQREAALRADLATVSAAAEGWAEAADEWKRLAWVANRPSELRRRLEARQSAPVVNLYPRLPRDGGEAS